jgi:hypothetical protein
MGGQTVITAVGNQFAYELLASNTIGVKDGVIITKEGRRIQLDANAIDSFDIPTGAQGTTNYYIIGYHLVTGNQSEQTCETFVQLMENGTDTIPEGSFRDGDDEVFVSLYRVEQDDLTIGTITLLLPQLSGSFQSQISELNNDLTASDNLKFEFMTDGDGNYGYRGADDSFIPFSSAVVKLVRNNINSANTQIDVKPSYTDYSSLTANNFLVVETSAKSAEATTYGYAGSGRTTYFTGSYSLPIKSYNSTSGILTITPSQVTGSGGDHGGQNYSSSAYITCDVYLVVTR